MSCICWTSWHCIQDNKNSLYDGSTKAITGSVHSTRVRLGNEELSFVEEFRYLGHVMTADCGDDKDVVKQFIRQNTRSWQYAGQDVLIITTSHIVTQFMDVLSGVILTRTLLYRKLLYRKLYSKTLLYRKRSVILTHSNDLIMSSLHQPKSGICDERNWPYQCGVSRICLQLDEQSNNFTQQYCYCHCQ